MMTEGLENVVKHYLSDVSQYIKVDEGLRSVIETYYSDQTGSVCATLIDLKNSDLRSQYSHGTRFLLQVWSQDSLKWERALRKRVRQCQISCVQAVHDEPGNSVIYVLDPEDAHWRDSKDLVYHIDCFNKSGEMGTKLEIRDFSDILGGLKRNEANNNNWCNLRFKIAVVGKERLLIVSTKTSLHYFNITMCYPSDERNPNRRVMLECIPRKVQGPV